MKGAGLVIKNKVRISILAAAIMFFGASAAYAAKTISTVQYDGSDKVIVRIQSDEKRASQAVSVRITDAAGHDNSFEQGYTDDQGVFEFSYVNNTGSGKYKIYAYMGGELITGEYIKMNHSSFDEFVQVINEQHKSSAPDGAPIKAVFDNYARFVDLDLTELDSLKDSDAVYQFIADDVSYRGKISRFADVQNAFYAAVMLESFKENGENIFDLVQTDPYSLVVSEFAPTLVKAAETVKSSVKPAVLSSLGNEYSSGRSLAETMELQILLRSISDATHWNDVKTILDVYKDELGIKTDGAGSSVFKAMEGKRYNSYTEVVSDFNTLLSSAANNNSGGGSGGGGGGGSSGGGGGKTVLDPRTVQAPQQNTVQDAVQNGEQEQQTVNAHSGKLPFTDMNDAKWAIEAVLYIYERGVVSGVSDTLFEPNRFVTRAEAVKLLMTMAGYEPENTYMPFTDVKEDDWYYPYVAAAYRRGVVSGRSDDFFDAQSMVSRQEMAVMTYRTLMLMSSLPKDLQEIAFADREEIADWALDAVKYLYSKEIMIGRTGSRFDPTDNITRAESAMVIYNVLKAAQ